MGCMTSTPDEEINMLPIKQEASKERIKYKFLLLGAGLCGKSTLLRQIRHLHGRGFRESELMWKKDDLTQNVIEAMSTLAIHSNIFYDQGYDTKVNYENEEIRTRVARMIHRQKFTQQHCADFTALWNDQHIHNVLEFRHTFLLQDTCEYLFNKMDDYWKDDYVPTFEDLIHLRQRTTGINAIKFELTENNGQPNEIYEIWEGGGQKHERKKWIHFFDNASAIIYVAALSGYNQMDDCCYSRSELRMKEAIGLFRGVVNLDVFRDSHWILFLNKYDLFREKVGKYSVKKYFKDYKGSDYNEDEIINFFIHKFKAQWRQKPGRTKLKIHVYIGSCMDTACCKKLFEITRDIVRNNHVCGLPVQQIKYIILAWYKCNMCKQSNSFVNNSMTQIILLYIGEWECVQCI